MLARSVDRECHIDAEPAADQRRRICDVVLQIFVCDVEISVVAERVCPSEERRSVYPHAILVIVVEVDVILPCYDAVCNVVAFGQASICFEVDVAEPPAAPRINAVERVVVVLIHRSEVTEVRGRGRDRRSVVQSGALSVDHIPLHRVVLSGALRSARDDVCELVCRYEEACALKTCDEVCDSVVS